MGKKKGKGADAPGEEGAVRGQEAFRHLENPAFTAYYRVQLGLDAEQWAPFEAVLRTPLPVTFRFAGQDARAQALILQMYMLYEEQEFEESCVIKMTEYENVDDSAPSPAKTLT